MSKTRMSEMSCGCEFWVGLDASGELYPEMNYCKKHENQAATELAELRAELEKTAEKASYLVVLRKQIEDLQAELKNRPVVVMTETEYKDYLSEQDRLKREAEEER